VLSHGVSPCRVCAVDSIAGSGKSLLVKGLCQLYVHGFTGMDGLWVAPQNVTVILRDRSHVDDFVLGYADMFPDMANQVRGVGWCQKINQISDTKKMEPKNIFIPFYYRTRCVLLTFIRR